MAGDQITIPPAFWKQLSYAEMSVIFIQNDGHMTPKQIKLLWKVLRRKGKPPASFQIDLDALPAEFQKLLQMTRDFGISAFPNVDNRTMRRMLGMPPA